MADSPHEYVEELKRRVAVLEAENRLLVDKLNELSAAVLGLRDQVKNHRPFLYTEG